MPSVLVTLALSLPAWAQAPSSPTQLTVTVDGKPSAGCAITSSAWTIGCVSAVNNIPVCPYGRVAWFPIPADASQPGQPYSQVTYGTGAGKAYPAADQSGKPIDFTKCVLSLPPMDPVIKGNKVVGSHD